MGGLSYLAEGETSDGAISLVQSHSFTVTISGDVTFGQNHTAICEACQREASFKTKDERTQRETRHAFLGTLPIAMKLRFSCTLRHDTSVGLLPGIAGKILVQRGVPLSFLSRFQTFTCSWFLQRSTEITGMRSPVTLEILQTLDTYQRIYAVFILPHGHQDAVLLQLVQVRDPQLVGLKRSQLQGTGQKPDFSIHM